MSNSALYYVACFGVAILIIRLSRPRNGPKLPPGPPADPIIGHARILPPEKQELVFHEWSKLYGDVMQLRIPGRSFIVLSSLKAANDLMDKRSGIYSDRPRLILYELMGWSSVLSLLHYGKQFQKHRRLMNEYMHQNKCKEYEPLQIEYARRLVLRLIDTPEGWFEHIERFAASVIFSVAYGHDIVSDDDPFLRMVRNAIESLTACGSVGASVVDFIPLLQHLPRWFPGTYYAYKARSYKPAVDEMMNVPYAAVKKQLEDGVARPSYLSYHLSQFQPEDFQDQEHVENIKLTAGAMYAAGAETTMSTLAFFIYSMVLFPECQKKAQEEIDRVIGRERLPELGDRDSLPYTNALFYEVFRWNPAVPLGIPHRSTEDDVYNGMFIPKGSVIIANTRTILRDEAVYSNPDEFDPTRYLPKPDGNSEPYPIGQFGFGRRICPGRHFADRTVWIAMSTILTTLTISKAIDQNGSEITPKLELATGGTSHPKPFLCAIKPRDGTAKVLGKYT